MSIEEEKEEYDDEELAKEKIVSAALNGDLPISRTPKPNQDDTGGPIIIPVMKRRSVEARERQKRQQYEGYDRDLENLLDKGYSIRDTREQVPGHDSSQFLDTSHPKDRVYHNRRSGFTQRGH